MRTVDPVRYGEKRAEILGAADRCFARHGFHGATIAQICAEAGISPGHLYHYFATKEAIIKAIAGSGLEYAASRSRHLDTGASPISALVTEIELLGNRDEDAGPGVLLDILAEAGRDPAIGAIVRESSAGFRSLLVAFLKTGQETGQIDRELDTESAAAILVSLIDANKTLAIRSPDLDSAKRSAALHRLVTGFLSP